MPAEIIKLYAENPEQKKVEKIVQVLKAGGIIVYPTDSVYGLGCDVHNARAIERLCHIKGIKSGKYQFSFICSSISEASNYVRNLSTPIYKMMKKALPGPYTFILPANNAVPKILKVKKKTIGIRIPNNGIPLSIVAQLGHPIMTTSIKDDDEILEYTVDPELIYDDFKHVVDVVIDGGLGKNSGSTILDCTTEEVEIIRHGIGDPALIL